jgi:catechol 2,3-dioxygenase-like lactoylglutathione lyase family enzyme
LNPSLKNVGAITLFVENLARSRSFYADVLGLTLIFEDEESAALDIGNTIINLLTLPAAVELIEPAAVAPADVGSRFQLTIGVDDTDAVCAELEKSGVALLNGPVDREWGKRTACFTDPDGTVWEIAQDIPPAAVA